MIIKKQGITNIIWGVIGKFFSGVKVALLGIIIGRFLGPEDLGVFSYVLSFVALFSVLSEFRLHNILVREISKDKKQTPVLLGSSLVITLFFAVIGYLSLALITLSMKENSTIKIFILIYGISYFFQTFRFLRAFFIAKKQNSLIKTAEVITTVVILSFAIIFAYLNLNIKYFIMLKVVDIFLFIFILILIYHKHNADFLTWKYDKKTIKHLVKSSFPLVLSAFALIIFQKIDQVMIKHYINEYAVGQYAAAVSITSIVSFVPIIISETLMPTLITIKEKKSTEAYIWFRQRFSDFLVWGSIVLSYLIMVLSPIIITTLYGDKYASAITVMKIFSWKGAFIALGAAAGQIMIIENKHQISYIKSILGGISNVLLNIIFITKYGMIGAVWASIIAFMISSFLSHLFIKRYQYIFWIQLKSIFTGLYYIFVDGKKFIKIISK